MVGAVVILTDVFFEAVLEMVQHPSFDADSLSELLVGIAMWIALSVVALTFAGALKLFAPLAARAVQAAVSRDREYLADATSVALTRNPAGLASALATLESSGQSCRTRTGHPAPVDREPGARPAATAAAAGSTPTRPPPTGSPACASSPARSPQREDPAATPVARPTA